jgi:hypothetical protein
LYSARETSLEGAAFSADASARALARRLRRFIRGVCTSDAIKSNSLGAVSGFAAGLVFSGITY